MEETPNWVNWGPRQQLGRRPAEDEACPSRAHSCPSPCGFPSETAGMQLASEREAGQSVLRRVKELQCREEARGAHPGCEACRGEAGGAHPGFEACRASGFLTSRGAPSSLWTQSKIQSPQALLGAELAGAGRQPGWVSSSHKSGCSQRTQPCSFLILTL